MAATQAYAGTAPMLDLPSSAAIEQVLCRAQDIRMAYEGVAQAGTAAMLAFPAALKPPHCDSIAGPITHADWVLRLTGLRSRVTHWCSALRPVEGGVGGASIEDPRAGLPPRPPVVTF